MKPSEAFSDLVLAHVSAGPREGRDRHRPPPSPEPHQHLQRGWPAEALEALRSRRSCSLRSGN